MRTGEARLRDPDRGAGPPAAGMLLVLAGPQQHLTRVAIAMEEVVGILRLIAFEPAIDQ